MFLLSLIESPLPLLDRTTLCFAVKISRKRILGFRSLVDLFFKEGSDLMFNFQIVNLNVFLPMTGLKETL